LLIYSFPHIVSAKVEKSFGVALAGDTPNFSAVIHIIIGERAEDELKRSQRID
jgi:hypothetical protein